MASATVNLDEQEVNGRLCSYGDSKVTDELYNFGTMLVREMIDVNHHLDSKGTTLAGYSSSAVALLVATSSFWRPILDQWASGVVFVAATCAIIASILSLKAASLYTFKWFSDDEWLHKTYLDDPDTLRRYRILTMHGIVDSHRDAADHKSDFLRIAQWALTLAGVLLLVALIDIAFLR